MTIGLAFLVALLRPRWYRTATTTYRRLARFFGIAAPDQRGGRRGHRLIQEFEFGMNWSAYSRSWEMSSAGPGHGGAGRLLPGVDVPRDSGSSVGTASRRRLHLACIWLVAAGTVLSAAVHHGRQLLDAAPGWLHDEQQRPPAPAQQHLGPLHQPRLPVGLHPRRRWPRSSRVPP